MIVTLASGTAFVLYCRWRYPEPHLNWSEVDVESIEAAIDEADKDLPPLRAFVLPGGCQGAAAFHAARTVCRRAERRVVALDRVEHLNDSTLHYLNRLSDLLFVLARSENVRAGEGDVEWTRRGGSI